MEEGYLMIVSTIISSAVAFGIVYVMIPPLVRLLNNRKSQALNIHVPGNVMVARPGGPAIAAGIAVGFTAFYFFSSQDWILVIIGTTLAAFVVGLIDDVKTMGGWFKPIGLGLAATPLLVFGAYDPNLTFPLFGTLYIPVLYIAIVILGIVLMGNTINSIDVVSGLASSFIVVASIALGISLIILGNYEVAAASLILAASSLAFYRFHKIPCKIFPGDSGALALGATYGAIAIVGGVEIIAAIAVLPAAIESFLYLSGTKRIVEHRNIKKSTALTDDFKIRATFEKGAIPSLVAMILADGKPMTEKQMMRTILGLATISGSLAIVTAIMTTQVNLI